MARVKETQRHRAERMTAQKYFTYASRAMERYYYDWVPQYLYSMKIDEVLCRECDYVPRSDSTQPRKAFRAHVKKHHPSTWFKDYAKPYIIAEEPDFNHDAELAELRALIYA